MSDPEHARMLLDMARKDLEALRGMYDAAIFAEELVRFVERQIEERSPAG